MSNKIYESPDGGKTVYSRDFGDAVRTLEHIDPEYLMSITEGLEDDLWRSIRRESHRNEALKTALENVKIIYYMSTKNGR
jgi:hypothetical protein